MPGGDRTGPNGIGPMTGRAAGYCAGNSVPGYAGGFRRGSFGRGGGRGFRYGFYATGLPGWQRGPGFGYGRGMFSGYAAEPYPLSSADELDMLKQQAGEIQNTLDSIEKRIQELETDKTD